MFQVFQRSVRVGQWTGAMGSPQLATVDKLATVDTGEELLERGASEVAKFIEEFLEWDHRVVLKP